MNASHNAVILAAGASTRLGRPKQLLTVNGEPLLQRTLRLVAATRPARLLVVLGAHMDQLAPLVTMGEVVANSRWNTGMASSLQVAAETLRGCGQPVLVTVTDQPALAATHLQALTSAFEGRQDIVTRYGPDGAAAGVPALLRAATLARAGELRDDEGFRRLWRREAVGYVEAAALARDLDTPDDVRSAVADGLVDA